MPVESITARDYSGDLVEIRTKMGRRLRATADHPFVVLDPDTQESVGIKLASDLEDHDWLPLSIGDFDTDGATKAFHASSGILAARLADERVILRPSLEVAASFGDMPLRDRQRVLGSHPRGCAQRSGDIKRSGALRLDEALGLRMPLDGGMVGTARNGTYVPFDISLDRAFWRVVGLYIAEGHCSIDGAHDRHRLAWSFHPQDEENLVDEVAAFWSRHGVKVSVASMQTTRQVSISSKIIARWWLDRLRVGFDAYSHRIPDLAWSQARENRRALLSGMWDGDGSWSYVNRGPGVVLEYGTASPELADGILRLLQMEGLIASQRIGRAPKSTVDTHWLRLSGADQVERALFLLPKDEQLEVRASLAKHKKRIRSTGYRRTASGPAAVRVTGADRSRYEGRVFSMEVPGSRTFAATGGLVTHNCFPKDVSALKQLAGNSGYHFQLLNSVIEVNELQKRRVIGKLTKHLGSLVGRRIALLGLAFKPNTDDMREASSLVLSARLQGEGAAVVAYDPVAEEAAKGLLPTVEMAASPEAALDGADAAILVTEWPQFAELDWAALAGRMSTPLIVDGRNYLDPEALRGAGFTYEGIGRGAERAGDRSAR
jgi:UDPglucose 6-dehydrogenase